MNKKIGWAVAAVALAAVLLVQPTRNHARAAVSVPASQAALSTTPRYGDFVIPAADSNPATQFNGNYPPQNFDNYMYGMMGSMMGGYGYYPGQTGNRGQYPPPYYYYNNGGVGGSVYGQ